jgi:Asp-tRNA(Asn)/Glu-tRNA(Gln) amidotransferase B subunit
MSYETFGNFGNKPVDEVIKAAKKQRIAGEVAHAVVSPLSYAVKKGASVISGEKGESVSDEQYVKAVILKVMRDNSLMPDKRLKGKLRSMIKEILLEEDIVSVHPHWTTPGYKKNGYKNKV